MPSKKTPKNKKKQNIFWNLDVGPNYYTFVLYKQSIFDPRPENCLSFSKKLS